MNALRAWLARPPAVVLTAEEAALLAALRAPARWQPDQPLTLTDTKDWGALLHTPLLLKLDVAMTNMALQQAQSAIYERPENVARAAGYAAGFRGAWQLAKSLSTLAGAPTGHTEHSATTDALGLEHLNP